MIPNTVYFQNDILPLLLSSCGVAGCHDPGTAQKDVILTSYLHVMQSDVIDPFDPESSDLIEVITESDPDKRMPPPPAAGLSEDQKNMLYTWIAQGALNNYCDDEECDTTNVTFAEQVWPIIQNNCFGCHSGQNPNGGIRLENFNDVRAVGLNAPGSPGSLIGAITWTSGNVPMPFNGSQLSECDISIVTTWVDSGMPNN